MISDINIPAQIVAAFAVALVIMAYTTTSRRKYLILQILCNILFVLHYAILGSVPAVASSLIGIFQSVIFYDYLRKKRSVIPVSTLLWIELAILMIGALVVRDIISALIIINSIIFCWAIWQKNLKVTYLVSALSCLFWIFCNFYLGAYVAIIGSSLQLIATLVGEYRLLHLHPAKHSFWKKKKRRHKRRR